MNVKKTACWLALALMISALASPAYADDKSGGADKVVNINTATADELALLPGIGPSKAQAIIAYRGKKPFKQPDEIMRVKGIGRSTFKKIEALLTVEGPTTLKPAAAKGSR